MQAGRASVRELEDEGEPHVEQPHEEDAKGLVQKVTDDEQHNADEAEELQQQACTREYDKTTPKRS